MDYFHNIVKANGSNPKNQSPSSAKDDILDSAFLTIKECFAVSYYATSLLIFLF
jgi:hypothetical protein